MTQEITMAGLARVLLDAPRQHRLIVAIAGPPGVGKSTFARRLLGELEAHAPGVAAILPMDGYHFDDRYLDQKGWRARKGAPHTFDVAGYGVMLSRLRADTEEPIAIPIFDRDIEVARAGAAVIPQSARIILTEGNYLLLDTGNWRDLRQYFDVTVMLRAADDTITARLEQRWFDFGFGPDEARRKLAVNDLPNVKTVITQSAPADYEVWTDR